MNNSQWIPFQSKAKQEGL